MTKILVLGGSSKLFHNLSKLGSIFQNFLTKEGYIVKITEDMNHLLPENINTYQVIIDYTTHQIITKSQAKSIQTGIKENSILYLGVHGATTSYNESKEMLKMIGARFVKHPPIRKIKVIVENVDHPILEKITDFTIRDELYLQEYFPPFQTLLSTKFNGQTVPISWIKPYGKGTVFYLALGHGRDQLKNKNIQQIIKNVIKFWLSK